MPRSILPLHFIPLLVAFAFSAPAGAQHTEELPRILERTHTGAVVDVTDRRGAPEALRAASPLDAYWAQDLYLRGVSGTPVNLPRFGVVNRIVEDGNGGYYAAGTLQHAGVVPVNNIAHWNGLEWAPLGSGVNGVIEDMVRAPNGDLYVAGGFLTAGGKPAPRVARWDGFDWHAVPGLFFSPYTLLLDPNGLLYAGGLGGVAYWDGQQWTPIAAQGPVYDLALAPDGDLLAVGNFVSIGGVAASRIARWNGQHWSALGTGLGGMSFAVNVDDTGHVYAGGLGTRQNLEGAA